MSGAKLLDTSAEGIATLAGLAHGGRSLILDKVDAFLSRFIAYPNEHARPCTHSLAGAFVPYG